MSAEQRNSDDVWVWRMLLQGRDHLRLCLRDPALLGAWEAAPGPTGAQEWDVLLAAITAHEFDEAGLEAPEWSTNTPPLLVPWCPAHPFLSHDRVQTQTPDWLKRHKIYIPARDLETA